MMICVLLGQRLGPDTDKKFLAIGCCHYDCSTLQFHQTLSSGINCTFIKNFFNSVIRNNLHLIVHTPQVNILQKSRSFARDRDSNFHLPKKFLAFLNSNFHIFGQFVIKMLNSGLFGKILGISY